MLVETHPQPEQQPSNGTLNRRHFVQTVGAAALLRVLLHERPAPAIDRESGLIPPPLQEALRAADEAHEREGTWQTAMRAACVRWQIIAGRFAAAEKTEFLRTTDALLTQARAGWNEHDRTQEYPYDVAGAIDALHIRVTAMRCVEDPAYSGNVEKSRLLWRATPGNEAPMDHLEQIARRSPSETVRLEAVTSARYLLRSGSPQGAGGTTAHWDDLERHYIPQIEPVTAHEREAQVRRNTPPW